MATAITFPIQTYNALLGRCLRTSREYALLRNGVVKRNGRSHQSGIVQVLCKPDEAKLIFALAANFYPLAVSQISKEAHPREQESRSSADGFRRSEHLLQIYEGEPRFLDTLASFVAAGLLGGQGVICIGVPDHLRAVDLRLRKHGIDPAKARRDDAYVSVDAESVLSQFLIDGWPDEERFHSAITELLLRARGTGRSVRAFGEMVAVLWERGQRRAALRLEELWENLRKQEGLSLFCAYPRSGLTCESVEHVAEVCAAHSRIISCEL